MSGARLMFLFVAWFAISSPAAIVSNLLANPGFESGSGTTNAGWQSFNNVQRLDWHPRSGSYATKMFGNWGPPGVPNGSSVEQVFPAEPGQTWEGSGWVSSWADDPIAGSNRAQLSILFLDGASNPIWSVYSAERMDTNKALNTWHPLSVRSTAPVNTEWVRFTAYFLQPPDFSSGAAWFDDSAFGLSTVTNRLRFADQWWAVQEHEMTPGPNLWSTNGVWVDENGRMHLAIRLLDDQWHSAMANNEISHGYGTYEWRLASRVDLLERGTMLGLFTYEATKDDIWNEIDFEFSRTALGMGVSNLQFAIQPWYHAGNLHRAPMSQDVVETTHRFLWTPGDIRFLSYVGHGDSSSGTNEVFSTWTHAGADVPVHSNEIVYMNFYLLMTNAPLDTQQLEVVVSDFRFTPFDGVYLADDFEDGIRSNAWELNGIWAPVIEETGGVLRVSPDGDWQTAGFITADTLNWNNRDAWFVFSALLKTVAVDVARSGFDVRTVISLSSTSENAWVARDSCVLYGLYDVDGDEMALVFTTKTNQPNENGGMLFSGTVANVSALLSGGGLELGFRLGRGEYNLILRDAAGAPLNVLTNMGAAEGLHHLGETMRNSFWLVGAMNEESGRGVVEWERVESGVDLPVVETQVFFASQLLASRQVAWTSYFCRSYIFMQTTNLVSGPWISNQVMRARPPLNVYTGEVGGNGRFFRVETR